SHSFFFLSSVDTPALHSFPTRRSSDLHFLRTVIDVALRIDIEMQDVIGAATVDDLDATHLDDAMPVIRVEASGFGIQHDLAHDRSEEHTSELQSRENLVCRLLLEKKKK